MLLIEGTTRKRETEAQVNVGVPFAKLTTRHLAILCCAVSRPCIARIGDGRLMQKVRLPLKL